MFLVYNASIPGPSQAPSTCGRAQGQPGREGLNRPPYARTEDPFLKSGQPQHISTPSRRRVHHSIDASICRRYPFLGWGSATAKNSDANTSQRRPLFGAPPLPFLCSPSKEADRGSDNHENVHQLTSMFYHIDIRAW